MCMENIGLRVVVVLVDRRTILIVFGWWVLSEVFVDDCLMEVVV